MRKRELVRELEEQKGMTAEAVRDTEFLLDQIRRLVDRPMVDAVTAEEAVERERQMGEAWRFIAESRKRRLEAMTETAADTARDLRDVSRLYLDCRRVAAEHLEQREAVAAERDRWYARAMAAEDRLEDAERFQEACRTAMKGWQGSGTVPLVGDESSVEDAYGVMDVTVVWGSDGANTCTGGELFDDICKLFGGTD